MRVVDDYGDSDDDDDDDEPVVVRAPPPNPNPKSNPNPNLNAKKRPATTQSAQSTQSTPAKKKAKTEKTEKKEKKPKGETRLTVVDPLQRTWIYMVIDKATNKIIYVGQTIDESRRWKQHAAKEETGLQEYLKRHETTFDRLEIRIVKELPDGCARRDANKFEAYFISKYKTMYDMLHNRDAANDNNGNYARKVDPDAVAAEIEKGYMWPPDHTAMLKKIADDSPELRAATGMVEILKTIQCENAEIKEEVQTALVKALDTKSKHEKGPYGLAVEAYDEYAAMPAFKQISRAHLTCNLNTIKDVAPSDRELQKEYFRWIMLYHQDKKTTDGSTFAPIGVGEAKHVMGLVKEWLGQHAEEQLDLTTSTAQRCLKLRDWSAAHDGAKPSSMAKQTAKAATGDLTSAQNAEEEASLGKWMHDWKGKYGKPHSSTARVLLRHFPKLLDSLFGRSQDERTQDMAQTVKAMLKEGYAVPMEREAFPEKQFKSWPCDVKNEPSYNFMNKFLRGQNASKIDVVLDGVDANRALWMRAQHTANAPLEQERMRQEYQTVTERARAVTARLQAA